MGLIPQDLGDKLDELLARSKPRDGGRPAEAERASEHDDPADSDGDWPAGEAPPHQPGDAGGCDVGQAEERQE